MKFSISYFDPIENKAKNYLFENEKQYRMYHVLQMVLRNECPPNREDYCCMIDETEEPRCKECWTRYSLKDE